MRNISRTTLRELKKRYLNILKKCFLANLMAFGMVTLATPAMAGEDRLALGYGETKEYNSSVTFEDLESNDSGGAIWNSGTITFAKDTTATFTGNSAYIGGAIYNENGAITFGENSIALFDGNNSACGGNAIWNNNGTITFEDGSIATFTNNTSSSNGGAIYNTGTITFGENSTVTYTGNSASYGSGGAIYNTGTITFGGDATFTNNSAFSGGAIYNSGTITFNDSFLFSDNTLTKTNANGADIQNLYGTINFAHGEGKVGTLDGGIYQFHGSPKINKTGTGTLILGDNMVNRDDTNNNSQFNQSAGLTIAHADKLTFAKTNTITGGELRVHGNSLAGLKASVSSGAMLTYLTTNASEQTVALPSGLTVNGAILTLGAYTDEAKAEEIALAKVVDEDETSITTKLLTTGTIDRARYNLTSDISGATKVIFKDSDVTIASGTYNTPYDFENARIANANSITFNGNTSFKNSVKSAGNGGAIYNKGYMLLSGENTFGGYLQDTEDADGDGDKTEYILDSDGNKISLGNEAKQGGAIYNSGGKKEGDVIAYGMTLGKSAFMGNTALSSGGAIYNTGYMNFTDEAVFEGNISRSETGSAQGGAIINTNTLDFKGNVTFQNNKTQGNTYSEGGAIYTGAGSVTSFETVDFISNKTISDKNEAKGGAIHNNGTITMGSVLFEENQALGGYCGYGGAIFNTGTLELESAEFKNNLAQGGTGYGGGGAIYASSNSSNIILKNAIFTGNKAESLQSVAQGGAVRTVSGKMNFEGHTVFGGYLTDNNGDYVLDSEGNKISLGNISHTKEYTKADGTVTSGTALGGAIHNEGGSVLTFDSADFIGNKAISDKGVARGGAIFNYPSSINPILFNGVAQFKDNMVKAYSDGAGGAVNNQNGSVVFEDTDNNTETPAVPNITYGMTFKGDTTFTGNKAEVETNNSYGGAIANSGYMLLSGDNTFGGYQTDENGEYVLDSEGNKISLGNEAKYGGAIYNTGGKKEGDVIAYGMTLGKSTFMNNTALSQGGAIFNSGYMNFTDEALFEGNKASSQGGAIYNQNGIIDFNKKAEFVNNEVQNGSGGAISNSGYMNFASADFIGNKTNLDSSDAQGVLINSGYVIFKGYVLIKDNITTSGGRTFGGTVWNSDTALESSGKGIYFKGHTDFIGNKATANRTTYGGGYQ